MTSYTLNQIKKFGHDSIQNIIPLDDQSIDEMVQYALSTFKTRDSMSSHFVDLLGPTDQTFDFVGQFCDMVFGSNKSVAHENVPKVVKTKEPTKPIVPTKPKGTGVRLVKKKIITTTKGRMTNNSKNGSTTSDMFDLKPATVEKEKVKQKVIKKKIDNIEELDKVLIQLEIANDERRNGDDIRICNCNATRHPLFEMYPNCLNCGKIICEKEGLQPCSFCGASLMSNEERAEISEIINKEKEKLEDEANNVTKSTTQPSVRPKKKNVIKISLNNTGQNNFKVQEKFFKQIEDKEKQRKLEEEAQQKEKELIKQNQEDLEFYKSRHQKDEELIKAEERLAMLLNFQDNGAERTKIIDHAADFDLPSGENGGSLWASPMERVLQFKRQQKLQNRMREQELQRSGRGAMVINADIMQDGKLVYQNGPSNEDIDVTDNLSDDEEITELQSKINEEKKKQFNNEVKNVYDYSEFTQNLHKPIYKGNIKETSNEDSDEMLSQMPALGTIVQLGDAEEQENQLFSMIGV